MGVAGKLYENSVEKYFMGNKVKALLVFPCLRVIRRQPHEQMMVFFLFCFIWGGVIKIHICIKVY